MLLPILQNTPRWVFALFIALLWLGLRQTLTRRVKLSRVLAPALGLSAFSLYGVLSAWPSQPLVWLAWLAAAALVAGWVLRRDPPQGSQYEPDTRAFTLPGSWVPLLSMLGLFTTKYAVGVSLAVQAEWVHDAAFPLACAVLYGSFSGLFAGRAARLWQLALRTDRAALRWQLSSPTH